MALYERFTEETGIKVNLIEGGSDALIQRIVNEGEFSPADMMITVDAGRLWRAAEKDLFQSIESPILNARVPAHLRHPSDSGSACRNAHESLLTTKPKACLLD